MKQVLILGLQLAKRVERILIQQDEQVVVVYLASLPLLPGPYVANLAGMSTLVLLSGHTAIVCNLGFKRFDETANHGIRVSLIT